jgi:HSP20 family protein
MEPIERAPEEIRALHDEIAQAQPAPGSESSPHPLPPGADPVAYALREVARLRQEVERARTASRPDPPAQVSWVPRASVYAGEAGSVVVLEIPGVARSDVAVTVANGELVIRGERKLPRLEDGLKPIAIEQSWGVFERRFPMPAWCTPDGISARCSNGVLEIGLARKTEAIASEIQIEVG